MFANGEPLHGNELKLSSETLAVLKPSAQFILSTQNHNNEEQILCVCVTENWGSGECMYVYIIYICNSLSLRSLTIGMSYVFDATKCS